MKVDAAAITCKLYRGLEARFAAPAWALLREVTNATGFKARRSADAVAISLYPSRGLSIHGIEVKATRSDWLRELGNPEKSEPIQKYCDFWWIVAPSTDVVHVDELPPTWGLIVMRKGGGLVQKVAAPKLEAADLDISFVAALGRRMNESVNGARLHAMSELKSETKPEEVFGESHLTRQLEKVKGWLEDEKKTRKEFEDASGVLIASWDAGNIGEAVKAVQRFRYTTEPDIMGRHINVLKNALAQAEEARKALEPFRTGE